jgi:sulfite dehydrogenase (quinone) subunit SoeC
MHPAYSIILFTLASGAGFGLLAWLALLGMLGALPLERCLGGAGFGLAFALITGGLIVSTRHLGRPERAWRALSQWRTSWLSREGILALACYVPGLLLALDWLRDGRIDALGAALALLTITGAVATLCATGMIYASLATIRQWHQPLTMPIYLVLGLASGAVLLNLLTVLCGSRVLALPALGIALVMVGACLKWAYWLRIEGQSRRFTAEAATGLGPGRVRLLEAPHTQPNFVMREMGFGIARKHAVRLRRLCLISAFAVPMAGLVATLAGGQYAALAGAVVAAASMAAGLCIERWLFFAEAEHVSMLYYGRDAA